MTKPASAHAALTQLRAPLLEPLFVRALSLERKRAERSRSRFVLMLVAAGAVARPPFADAPLARAVPAVVASTRETDVVGWHKEPGTLGVIFSELGAGAKEAILAALRAKVTGVLGSVLRPGELESLTLTFHWFPDDWKGDEAGPAITTLYPDLVERGQAQHVPRALKRAIDLLGSAAALLVLSPLLLLIALAVKVSSPGPVLFRQPRIGRYGVPFTCLKFRSMHAVNDPRIHLEYVKRFIAGTVEPSPASTNGKTVYKLTNDPRLTVVGRLLRKASLDELPQFLNVLRGEMSMVGPRPPVPYELEAYDVWHRGRLLDVKPGITGLWQVSGRSRLSFDDMVRLDLRYATTWSLALDLKILLKTPRAVFSGEGAY